MHELLHYNWPGNIRELRNVLKGLLYLQQMALLNKNICPFIQTILIENQYRTRMAYYSDNDNTILSLQEEMDEHEKKVIERALQHFRW